MEDFVLTTHFVLRTYFVSKTGSGTKNPHVWSLQPFWISFFFVFWMRQCRFYPWLACVSVAKLKVRHPLFFLLWDLGEISNLARSDQTCSKNDEDNLNLANPTCQWQLASFESHQPFGTCSKRGRAVEAMEGALQFTVPIKFSVSVLCLFYIWPIRQVDIDRTPIEVEAQRISAALKPAIEELLESIRQSKDG